MDKEAFKISPGLKRTMTGAAIGGGMSAATGLGYKQKNKNMPSKGQILASRGLLGAALGGMAGHAYHDIKELSDAMARRRSYFRGGRGGSGRHGYSPPPPSNMGFDEALNHLGAHGKETTKAEVKKKYRDMVKKHHPDIGGSEEKMKQVNEAWDKIQKDPWFHKLAYLMETSFWKGFEKRAVNWHRAAELGGLGLLAAPSASSLVGHPWSEKAKDTAEVVGLGTLAAPYLHDIYKERKALRALRPAVK